MFQLKSRRLECLTQPEVAEQLKVNPLVILPAGSVEQHGPHLPAGTDSFAANIIAEAVAERMNGLVIPGGPLGVTPFHIVAVHRWKYADTTYLDFISDPEIVNERKDSRVDPLNKIQRSIIAACNLGDLYIEKRIRANSRPVFLCRFKLTS